MEKTKVGIIGSGNIGTDLLLKLLRSPLLQPEWMAGIDDAVTGNADIAKALANIPPQEAIVALVHEPDLADSVTQYAVDVQLSGHSHGGQINVPGMRRLYLPRLARKYPEGLYQVVRNPCLA